MTGQKLRREGAGSDPVGGSPDGPGRDGGGRRTPRSAASEKGLWFRLVPLLASGFAVLVGVLVLAGWASDVEAFKRVSSNLDAMNPVSAAAFILAGVALALLRSERADRRLRFAGQACAAVVAAIGLFRIATIVSGWDPGIDQLLFAEKLERETAVVGAPNRMGFNAALNFLLIGCALLLLDRPVGRGRWPAQFLALAAMTACLLPLVGYAYGIKVFRDLYALGPYVQMAFNTALAFVALAAGVLCARPERGMLKLLTSDTMGGVVARRLLPFALLVPVVLGWLSLEGQRLGLYDARFAGALFIVADIIVVVVLIGWYAALLHRQDAGRKRAEAELRRSEEYHRAVVRSLPDAVVVLFDHDLSYRLVEGPALAALGWDRRELEGKTLDEAVNPEQLAYLEPFYRAALAGETRSFETRSQRLDRYFAVQVSPVRDAGAQVSGG